MSFAPTVHAAEHLQIAGLDVAYWKPDEASRYVDGRKAPVLVFSHSLGGCATESDFLMSAFSRAGYVVFAPNHADAKCAHQGTAPHPTESPALIEQPGAWNEQTLKNRREDISDLLKAIEADPDYGQHYDMTAIGLLGHGLGGYDMLAIAGGYASWKIDDPAIKAVLLLSPYTLPLLQSGQLETVKTPLMYQLGARDTDTLSPIDKKGGAYDKAARPKYLVEFSEAIRSSWTDRDENAHRLMISYGIAFLDRYLKAQIPSSLLTDESPGVKVLRYDSEEGVRDKEPRAPDAPVSSASHQATPQTGRGTIRDKIDQGRSGGPFSSGPFFGSH